MLGFILVILLSDKARETFLGPGARDALSGSFPGRRELSDNATTAAVFDLASNHCNLTWALDIWAYEDYYNRAWFACLVYIFGILFIFLGIAVVCDDFFCTSLEVICEKLNLSEQVAGATFMAAGSSAPELATSLVTVFTSRNSTGLGTILGSAVFNLVMIVSMSGIFGNGPQGKVHRACETASVAAGGPDKLAQGLFLDWRPLVRDATFYVASLIICVVFALTSITGEQYEGADIECQPGYNWWEGLILVVLYGVYILVMVKNDDFMACLKKCGGMPAHIDYYIEWNRKKKEAAKEKLEESFRPDASRQLVRRDTLSKQQSEMVVSEEDSLSPHKLGHRIHGAFQSAGRRRSHHNDDDEEEKDDSETKQSPETLTSPGSDPGIELTSLKAQEDARATEQITIETVEVEGHDDANDADEKAAEQAKEEEAANMSNFKQLRQMVDNSAVSDDENVKLIASTVVDLRDSMVSLQGRLVPLFRMATTDFKVDPDSLSEEEEKSCCALCCGKTMQAFSWPWQTVFKITIPACERDSYQKWEKESIPYAEIAETERSHLELDDDEDAELENTKWFRGKYSKQKVDTWYARSYMYWLSFVMSIVWIWLTSWGMVDFALHLGCLLNIGPYIMGLVVLAAGTSIPDTLSSIMVARDGFGDMAVANAIGSNVFNIFLGIGLPMLLTEFAWGEPFMTTGSDPAAVLLAGVMLVLITIIMIIIFVASRWVLSKPLSGFLMIFFFLYIALSILFEAEQQLAYEPIMAWLDYKCV